MTRNYGVANIDGVDYCVMTLMKKENKANRGNGKADSYRYYVCPLKIDGEDYTAKIVVGKKERKQLLRSPIDSNRKRRIDRQP